MKWKDDSDVPSAAVSGFLAPNVLVIGSRHRDGKRLRARHLIQPWSVRALSESFIGTRSLFSV